MTGVVGDNCKNRLKVSWLTGLLRAFTGEEKDGIERCPEFMRQHREEFIPALECQLQLLFALAIECGDLPFGERETNG